MELHTSAPWTVSESSEDYQGHFITNNGRTIAATITQDACVITQEEVANAALIRAAPALLKVLRQIGRDAHFRQEDGAKDLGERLIYIERAAKAAIELYELALADWLPNHEDDANE